MTIPDDGKEAFLERWSRLKQEAKDQPPGEKAPDGALDPKEPAPALPPVEELTIESDFRGFFHPKVDEDVRRAALKRLFSDPHFNVMDGLDVYIDDYSKTEPIPPAMLAGLRQAQNILQWAKEDEEQRARAQRATDQQSPGQSPPQEIAPPADIAAAVPRPVTADTTIPEPVDEPMTPAKR
jgi:hypothetical protein